MYLKNRPAFAALVGPGPDKIMSASELARRVERTPSTIDHLRHGRMSRVTEDLAMSIESELGVKTGTLFSSQSLAAAGTKKEAALV